MLVSDCGGRAMALGDYKEGGESGVGGGGMAVGDYKERGWGSVSK